MFKKEDKNCARRVRHNRIRTKLSGSKKRPRLCVFRSNKFIYCQVINDEKGMTLLQANTKELKLTNNVKSATELGKLVASKALKAGIKEVVFDRSGYLYHGRIKALAESAREAGLKF